MIKRAIFVFIVLIVLTACQNTKEWTFVGETKNWRVVYEVVMEKKQESSILQIEYIGKKPIPKQIGYRIETPSGSSTEIGLLNDQGILMITDVCGECTNVNEETGINMAVEWGRQIELFTLQFEKIEE